MNDIPVKPVAFRHVQLRGSAYQVGLAQGQILRHIPGWIDFLRSGAGAFDAPHFAAVLREFNEYCPGVNEEVHGLADGCGVAPQDVIYYAATHLRAPGCSHFAVTPAAAEDGRPLAARTFDYSEDSDDLRLCSTHIEGKYAHLGFSIMLFGRSEGMNEHGLVVTTSAGGMPVGPARPPIQTGLQFWALTRALLENCRTVDEALALAQDFPLCCNAIFLLSDRAGQAALLETYGPRQAARRASAAEPCLAATNHYALPEMQTCQQGVMRNSQVRLETMRSALGKAAPRVSRAGARDLLAAPYPAGLSCHFYKEYFGTVHSMVFDPTAGEVDISFGSANANGWKTFTLQQTPQPGPYVANLPLCAAEPGFFEMEPSAAP